MAMLVIIRGYHTWVMDEVMDATLKPIEEAGMPLEMCKRPACSRKWFQKMVPEHVPSCFVRNQFETENLYPPVSPVIMHGWKIRNM